MKVDTNALVSATDLNRNSGQLIARAEGGERLVVLNQNRPVAAIVPIDDLHRLESLDAAPTAAPAAASARSESRPLRDLVAQPGYTAIGLTADGSPVELKLACNTWAVGADDVDLTRLLSAVLNGAHPGAHPPIHFAIATTELAGPVSYHVSNRSAPPIVAIATDVADDVDSARRFVDAVEKQLNQRTALLKRAGLASVEELRGARPDEVADVADLVIVLDLVNFRQFMDRRTVGPFHKLVELIGRKSTSLGVHLWLFEDESNMGLAPSEYGFGQSIALRMSRAASARRVVHSVAPLQIMWEGDAFLRFEDSPQLALARIAERDTAAGVFRFTTDPNIAWDAASDAAGAPGA